MHNGPVVDDREPATRGPRFLWYSWPAAEILHARIDKGRVEIAAQRPGEVRRDITATPSAVTVADTLLNPNALTLQVSWLLHPQIRDTDAVTMEGDVGIAARERVIDGWFSPTYALRLPSRVRRVRREGMLAKTPIVTHIYNRAVHVRVMANR